MELILKVHIKIRVLKHFEDLKLEQSNVQNKNNFTKI